MNDGPGDVDVRPRDALADELLEEQPGGEHAAPALALVREVGDAGVETRRAGRAAAASARQASPAAAAALDDPVAEGVVVAHDAGDAAAEGDHLRAGEGGDVDDGVGLGLAGQADAVTEDHAALGVGVEDLDGGAVAHRHDVTGTLGGAARHVLGEAEVAGDRDRAARARRRR